MHEVVFKKAALVVRWKWRLGEAHFWSSFEIPLHSIVPTGQRRRMEKGFNKQIRKPVLSAIKRLRRLALLGHLRVARSPWQKMIEDRKRGIRILDVDLYRAIAEGMLADAFVSEEHGFCAVYVLEHEGLPLCVTMSLEPHQLGLIVDYQFGGWEAGNRDLEVMTDALRRVAHLR